VWEKIKDIIAKTLITVQPSLSHQYMSCRPHDFENSSCFEILGFDIMLDYKLRPWLIEVNHSPSFNTDSDLDKDVKNTVIGDSIKLLNLSSERKE
jgi:tubulin polyglutamylase TTLL6/13